MIDPIMKKYAEVLVNYSLELKKGDELLISGTMVAEPLIKAVYQEQLNYSSPFTRYLYENVDAMIRIIGNYNTRSLSNVDPEKIKKRNLANRELMEIYMERAARGELRWNICQFPTHADAQEANMSLAEYEDFVFRACHLDKDDPVGFWENLGAELKRIAD